MSDDVPKTASQARLPKCNVNPPAIFSCPLPSSTQSSHHLAIGVTSTSPPEGATLRSNVSKVLLVLPRDPQKVVSHSNHRPIFSFPRSNFLAGSGENVFKLASVSQPRRGQYQRNVVILISLKLDQNQLCCCNKHVLPRPGVLPKSREGRLDENHVNHFQPRVEGAHPLSPIVAASKWRLC